MLKRFMPRSKKDFFDSQICIGASLVVDAFSGPLGGLIASLYTQEPAAIKAAEVLSGAFAHYVTGAAVLYALRSGHYKHSSYSRDLRNFIFSDLTSDAVEYAATYGIRFFDLAVYPIARALPGAVGWLWQTYWYTSKIGTVCQNEGCPLKQKNS